jgi:preprotein translocase subunit YajC
VQRTLTVGDEVMLGSGFVATVAEIPDEGEFLAVDLNPGVRVRVARGAIARVVQPVDGPVVSTPDTEPPTDLTKH